MQEKTTELEEENERLISKLQTKEVENEMLQKRLNELGTKYCTISKESSEGCCNGKDAAVVAREDFSAQFCSIKKRLKEAEEEQYQEDAAALRAELNLLQQQAISGSLVGMISMGNSPDHIQSIERS